MPYTTTLTKLLFLPAQKINRFCGCSSRKSMKNLNTTTCPLSLLNIRLFYLLVFKKKPGDDFIIKEIINKPCYISIKTSLQVNQLRLPRVEIYSFDLAFLCKHKKKSQQYFES